MDSENAVTAVRSEETRGYPVALAAVTASAGTQ